jgi:glycosyltransferase involved in cell wall biosynthesis
MLSVCIPTYNFNINVLVNELSKQIKNCNHECEILIIDDASNSTYKKLNSAISNIECVKYYELSKNIGRSKIRNLFIKYSKFEHLLFLDCDSIVISNEFISNYIKAINNFDYSVICGGRVYNKQQPERNKRLRWKYGIIKESQPLSIRLKSPDKSFMTNNFLIKKSLFEQIKFDERISEYGHEDTLFGFMLKQNNIIVSHIDNSILNGDIEDNAEFLYKTEKGIINLVHILTYLNYDIHFINDVTLLSFHKKIAEKKLINIVYYFFLCLNFPLRFLFEKGIINLKLFDFYKLGLLIKASKNCK